MVQMPGGMPGQMIDSDELASMRSGPSMWQQAKGALGGLFEQRRSGIGSREGLDPMTGFGARKQNLLQQADFAAGRRAGTYGQNQAGLVSMLEAQARGEGPSVAQRQMQDALQRNVSTQQALMASGGNARAAAQQAASLGGSIANQTGMARVQEQLGAQGLLGQTLGTFRGQDLQQMGMNDQMRQAMLQMELENAGLQQRGRLGMASELTARRGQDLGVPTSGERKLGLLSGLLGAS